jgi:two-component system chemotaxis sensor kinase CheA
VPGDTFDEFVEDYFAECDEHLSAIRRLLLTAEARSPRAFEDAEFHDLSRRLETVRSLSRIVELAPAEELAKALADVLHATTAAGTVAGKDVLDMLVAGVGLLDRSIQSKRGWHPVPDHRAFIAGTRDFMRRRREVYATAVVHSAAPSGELTDVEVDDDSPPLAMVATPRAGRADTGAEAVRIEVARVDDLMRMISELVVLRSRIDESLRTAGSGRALDDLRRTNRALERQLRGLRDGVARMRRVSVEVLFERIRVVTRELLRGSGKRVQLDFSGSETAIDAVLVDRLIEPMLQLVRIAALQHIEDRAVRLGRGKPAEGTIQLRARSTPDRVILEAEDDGDGARDDSRGSVVRVVSHGDIDAVRGAIAELGGDLSVSAVPWRGTRVTIELPMRYDVTDALLVTVGDQVMAIPLLSLREVLRLDASMMTSLLGASVIAYRGSALSLLTLHRHFGLAEAHDAKPHVLVVERDRQRLGLVVDNVTEIREIVVRPVTDPRVAGPGVMGATELGDGRLALIIDAAALMRRTRTDSHSPAPAT